MDAYAAVAPVRLRSEENRLFWPMKQQVSPPLDSMQEFGSSEEALTERKFNEMLHPLPFITSRAVRIVERLFEAAGASAILTSNPMQRYWRDVHACRLHFGQDYDTSRLLHGRYLMGLSPTPDL